MKEQRPSCNQATEPSERSTFRRPSPGTHWVRDHGGRNRGAAQREAKGWRRAVANGVWIRLSRLPPASPGLNAGFLAACAPPPPILNGVLRAELWGGQVAGRKRARRAGVFWGVLPGEPLPPYCQHDAYLVREPLWLWPTAWFIVFLISNLPLLLVLAI